MEDVLSALASNGVGFAPNKGAPSRSRALHARFGYCFMMPPGGGYPPILTEHRIRPGEPVTIDGDGGPVTALPVLLDHGDSPCLGFRFGGIAYTADLVGMPDASAEALMGLDVWIVDALRHTPHPTHFSLSDALAWIDRLKPKRAVLTNMHTDLDYDALREALPPHVEPAYDGMQLSA